jgi:Rrf2 family transcriptional regulator, iron-sulfur cluster assembly transcription factor
MSNSLFSRSSSHAVRALTYLARQPAGKLSGTREISESEHIPRPFIPKVLLPLRRAHLVRSFRGIRGGYDLAVPPEQINLLAIVRCMDGEPLSDCVLEEHPCSSPEECVLHPCWSIVREVLLGYLEHTTLADLARFHQSEVGEGCPDANPPLRGVERREK